MSQPEKTPGYRIRLVIRFTTDRCGRPLAHYWSHQGGMGGRYLRLPYEEAKLLVATGHADEEPRQ